MGKVTILPETTQDPISLIGRRAGICYGADISNVEKNYERGLDCIKSGHGRALEYVNIETIIDGYSARVIREWYTHIGGAPTRLQASTRYINYKNLDMYIPDSIHNNEIAMSSYISAKHSIMNAYEEMLNAGISKEDVANILPLGMATKVVDKRNLRNLIDMSHQRMCTRAYKEYRELFNDYLNAIREVSREWATLIDDLKVFKPKCEITGFCEEKKSCGRKPKRLYEE